MKKRERNDLRKLRSVPSGKRTVNQIRKLFRLSAKDMSERRVMDPIRAEPKKPSNNPKRRSGLHARFSDLNPD